MSENSPPQLDLDTLFTLIYNFLFGGGGSEAASTAQTVWVFINIAALFLAPLLLFGIIYTFIRMYQLQVEDKEQFEAAVQKARGESRGSEPWRRIIELVSSNNPTEWRHAVIEADTLLDKYITERGYQGDTLGEKLKNISPQTLRTIDAAWDAHKVRNEIAHAGSDFILTQREARRAVDNYRQVFEELGML